MIYPHSINIYRSTPTGTKGALGTQQVTEALVYSDVPAMIQPWKRTNDGLQRRKEGVQDNSRWLIMTPLDAYDIRPKDIIEIVVAPAPFMTGDKKSAEDVDAFTMLLPHYEITIYRDKALGQ